MFRNITLDDKKYFDKFNYQDYIGSELNFANIYAWKEFDELQIYISQIALIIKGKDFFFPPMAKTPEHFMEAIKWIQNYCHETDFPFSLHGVTIEMLPYIEEMGLIASHRPDFDEYIYNPESLITYSGKKYHAKRNLVNQFVRTYEYEFLSYQKEYFDDVITLIDDWTEQKGLTYEKKGIISILENLDAVGCFCDCLFIDGKLCGFSIGTIHNNAGIVLFEKANPNYIGIYPVIVQKFSEKHFKNLQFINRQEDMGIENLKASKLSYRPTCYVNKYQVTYDLNTQLKLLYKSSFNDSNAYLDYFFNKKIKQVKYLLKKNNIASVLYYRQHDLIIKDSSYPSVFLFAIATAKYYRRQGYMRQLITTTFNELYDNYIFAYLHADVLNFYERFGFIYYGATFMVPNVIKLSSETNLEKINEIYNSFTQNFDVSTFRDLSYFINVNEEVKADNGYVKLLENQQGYVIHDGKGIMEYLDGENFTNNYNYNMIRIINVQRFLSKFKFTPSYNLQISDDLIPENNISIFVNEGPTKIITIDEFTKIVFGNLKSLSLEMY